MALACYPLMTFSRMKGAIFHSALTLTIGTYFFRPDTVVFTGRKLATFSPQTTTQTTRGDAVFKIDVPRQRQVRSCAFFNPVKKYRAPVNNRAYGFWWWLVSCGSWSFIILPLLVMAQPVVLQAPENVTTCLGQNAHFAAEGDNGFAGWRINGVPIADLPAVAQDGLSLTTVLTDKGTTIITLSFSKPIYTNPTTIQAVFFALEGTTAESPLVYLNYLSNQYRVSNLTASFDQDEIHLNWLPREATTPTHYQLSIQYGHTYDRLIEIACDNCSNITDTHFDFYPEPVAGQNYYCFKVTGIQVLYPQCNDTEQLIFSSAIALISKPDETDSVNFNQSTIQADNPTLATSEKSAAPRPGLAKLLSAVTIFAAFFPVSGW